MALTYTKEQIYNAAQIYFTTNTELVEATELRDGYLANEGAAEPYEGNINITQLKFEKDTQSVVIANFEQNINSITAQRQEVEAILIELFTEYPDLNAIYNEDNTLKIMLELGVITVT